MTNGFNQWRDIREFPGFKGLSGFKTFLLRGNVIDLAVAVVIGSAFTDVVNSFAASFLKPLIALAGGGGQLGGILRIGDQKFLWGAFTSQVITFVLTAAIVYFIIVLPMHKLLARRASGETPAPATPTEVELLAEIRDLLRAQHGVGSQDPTPGRHGTV